MIEEAKGREISIPGPAGYMYESCVVIIANAIKHWREPAIQCVDAIHALMKVWFVKERERILDSVVPDKYKIIRDEMSRIVTKKKSLIPVEFFWVYPILSDLFLDVNIVVTSSVEE